MTKPGTPKAADLLIGHDIVPRVRTGSVVESSPAPFTFPSLAVLPVTTQQIEAEQQRVEEEKTATRDLVSGHAAHVRDDPIEFSRQMALWASGTGWRAYTDYIGARIMYPGYTAESIQKLLDSPVIQRRVRQLSEERLDALNLPPEADREARRKTLEKQMKGVVVQIADGLVAKMDSVRFLRFFGAATNNILVRMYHQGIHIDLDEFAAFKEVAIHAAAKKQSIILLPCHKSHLDYLTMSWLMFRCGLSLPHIVAGENLNMPVVGPMLQKCGAFFIRRSFGDDALYPTVVNEYVHQLLEDGKNIECFIEGSRSRTGKLLPPKLGILKYVLEGLQQGRTDDIWIAPISTQYDKVVETETYINELLGNPKEKETLSGLLLNTRIVQLQMGRIDVRFKKPFSLKTWLKDEEARRDQLPTDSSKPRDPRKEQGTLLKALGYQVLSDINSVAVIMPAALVGTVLLTIRGRGVGKEELVRRVSWLIAGIKKRGGRVADFAGMELETVVERALVVLKDLITAHEGLIEPTYSPSNRFELSFYRNQVVHLFVSECMLCAVLYTHVKAGGTAPSQRMHRAQVQEELYFLSRLLQHEFVYGTEGLEANMAATIAGLENDGVISVEGDMIGLSDKERSIGREHYDFYCFILWPFIETYWLAAVSLFALAPSLEQRPPSPAETMAWYDERAFHKSAQLLGKTTHQTGDLSYHESVNQATLANAFQRIVDLGIVQTRRATIGKQANVPLMALHPAWLPERGPDGQIIAHGRLWDYAAHLGTFRREGKNRRDGATLSTRVFHYCEAISPQVKQYTIPQRGEDPSSDFWATKPAL